MATSEDSSLDNMLNDAFENAPNVLPEKLHFPPTLEELPLYGTQLIQDWQTVFNEHVWNTPFYDKLVLHVLIGQLPSIKNLKVKIRGTYLDMRIHGCLFQDSGSGKGRGFNFAAAESEALGLKYQPITEITDAALIGTIETVRKWIPKEGEQVTYEVEPGWLHQSSGINVFAMNEAEVLFTGKTSQYAKNAMTYFQIAMNTIGTVDSWIIKKLSKGDPVVCKPVGSFLLTSYLPENLYETIIRRGFLQRMIVVVNDVTTEQRYQNAQLSIEGLNESEKTDITIDNLAERLKIINQFYSTQGNFKITQHAKDDFKEVLDDLFEPLHDIAPYQRKKLEEFVHRWLEIIYKLSFHHMVLRLGLTLKSQDVAYAKNFLVPVWRILTSFLEDSLVEPHSDKSKRLNEAMMTIDTYKELCKKKFTNKWVPEPALSKIMASRWNVQKRTSSNRLARLIYEEKLFECKITGSTPYLKLVKDIQT